MVLVNQHQKMFAVWGASRQTDWTYYDYNLNPTVEPKLLEDRPDNGKAFHGLQEFRVSISNSSKDLPGPDWHLDTIGTFDRRQQIYYTGGYNISPGEKHVKNVILFTGELRLSFKNIIFLKQHVVNMNVDDDLSISLCQCNDLLIFSYTQNALHYIDKIYFIKLPTTPTVVTQQRAPSLNGGGVQAKPQTPR